MLDVGSVAAISSGGALTSAHTSSTGMKLKTAAMDLQIGGEAASESLESMLHGTANQMGSRSNSPAPTDRSERSTPPGSPQQEIVAVHVNEDVHNFRKDMKKLIDTFLQPSGDRSMPNGLKLCELLLMAFMREKVAPFADAVIAENLNTWNEWCQDPTTREIEGDDLIKCFQNIFEIRNYFL